MAPPKAPRIWCLDDDDASKAHLRSTFELKYDLEFVDDVEVLKARVYSDEPRPELLLVELKLQKGCFLDVLREETFFDKLATPVMVVSAVEDADVMRFCFSRGVADYLIKPIRRIELLAKVERAVSSRTAVLGVRLDPITLSASREGMTSPALTPKEFQVLTILLNAGSDPIPASRLRETLWRGTQVSPKALDVHLSHLRKKIAKLGLRVERVRQGLTLVAMDEN